MPSRLLVIDHDDLPRSLLLEQLHGAGYEVHLAENGSRGLEATRELRPDLVLCDQFMPHMDGVEYCRSVKRDPELRSIYVAMLTARSEGTDQVEGLDAGADDVLVKPVEVKELLARVRAGLRIRRLQHELAEARHGAALTELATTLGHEINNPLTALFGHMELAKQYLENGDSRRVRHHVDQAGEVAARIAAIAQRLITLSDLRTKPYLGPLRMLDL